MNLEKFENLPFREAVKPKSVFPRKRWTTSPDDIVSDYLYKNLGKDADTICTQFKKRQPNLIHLLVKQVYNTSFGYQFRFRLVNNKLEETFKWTKTPNLTFTSHDYEVLYFNSLGQEMVKQNWGQLWHLKKLPFFKKHKDLYSFEDLTPKVISGFSKTFSSRKQLEFVKLRRKQEKFYKVRYKKMEQKQRLKEVEAATNALAYHNYIRNIKYFPQ